MNTRPIPALEKGFWQEEQKRIQQRFSESEAWQDEPTSLTSYSFAGNVVYSVRSHFGEIYKGSDLQLANMYADSIVEVESCFGYKTWPNLKCNHKLFKNIIREQVNSEDIFKFISIVKLGEMINE